MHHTATWVEVIKFITLKLRNTTIQTSVERHVIDVDSLSSRMLLCGEMRKRPANCVHRTLCVVQLFKQLDARAGWTMMFADRTCVRGRHNGLVQRRLMNQIQSTLIIIIIIIIIKTHRSDS